MLSNFNCGKRIKELRMQRGMTQEQLALNAGITPAYLGLVEREKRNATVMILERICQGMGVSLLEFFAVDTRQADEDIIGRQIQLQLNGLNDEEKMLVLQIVQNVMALRQKSMHTDKEGICC